MATDGPYLMVAGGNALNQPLHIRANGVFIQNLTAQWVQVDLGIFLPPNTSGSVPLGGTPVAVAQFASPPLVVQPAATAGQTCFLTYTEDPVPFTAGPTQGAAIASVTQVERFTKALLPAAGNQGRLAYVTDADRGLYLDTGTQWASLNQKSFDVMMFGSIGDNVADDGPAFRTAMTQAGITGGDVLVPWQVNGYKLSGFLDFTSGVRLVGYGQTDRWGQNPTSATVRPVKLNFTSGGARIAPIAGGHVRNTGAYGIHFDGTSAAGAIDGLLIDASTAGSDIVGVVFEHCMFSNFPRNQVNQPAAGAGSSMWAIDFPFTSFHDRDRASTGNLVDFAGPVTAVAEVTFDQSVFDAHSLAAQWCAKMFITNVRFYKGTVTTSTPLVGSNGLWLGPGSVIEGTHLEPGVVKTGIAVRVYGVSGHQIRPAFCANWATNIQIGDPTQAATATVGWIISGDSIGGGTTDVHITAGGSRRWGIILGVGDSSGLGLVILNDRQTVDGIYDVMRLDSGKLILPNAGVALPPLTWIAFPTTGFGQDAATGDLTISLGGAERGRINRLNTTFQMAGQVYGGSGVTANTAQTAAGLMGGTGIPTDAVGNNGDLYLRSDGGGLTTLYQRRAGVWVGIL